MSRRFLTGFGRSMNAIFDSLLAKYGFVRITLVILALFVSYTAGLLVMGLIAGLHTTLLLTIGGVGVAISTMLIRRIVTYRSRRIGKRGNSVAAEPPVFAESIARLFANKRTIETELGDRLELFREHYRTRGSFRAKLFYWIDVANSIRPKLIAKLTQLGFFGFAAELIRRYTSA